MHGTLDTQMSYKEKKTYTNPPAINGSQCCLLDRVVRNYCFEKSFICVIIWLIFVSCNAESEINPGNGIERDTHRPFLIVQKDQFPMLRNRASSEPWKSMMEEAIARSKNGSVSKPYDLQYYIGADALAYIVDEDNTQTHANRVKDAILDHNNGAIISAGAEIILNGSIMNSMKFEPSVAVLNSGENFVEIKLSKGTVQFFQ